MQARQDIHVVDQILRALAVAASVVVVALLVFVPLSTNDFWLQVKIGGMIWNEGKIPDTVLFTFSEPKDFPFHAHEWLPSILFYLLHESLGYENLLFVKGALGLLIFWLCFRLASRLGTDFLTSLFLSVLAMVMMNFRFFMRPEIFALLFMAILFNLIVDYMRSGRISYLLWTLPLSVLWANTHGSFPLVVVIMTIFAAGAVIDVVFSKRDESLNKRVLPALKAARPYLIFSVATFVATLANPYGLNLYVFAWDFSQWELTRGYIYEWLPTFSDFFMSTRGFWVFVFGAFVSAMVMFVMQMRLRASDILLVMVFGYLAVDRCRHIVFLSFITLYVCARLLNGRENAKASFRGALIAFLVLMLGGIFAVIRHGNVYGAYPYFTPSNNLTPELISYVRMNKIRGNVFNSYELGAELIQKFYPDLRPSIDSRIDAYGEQYFYDVSERIYRDEQFMRRFIDRYNVNLMLIHWWEFNAIKDMPVLKATGWRLMFADHKVVLLGKSVANDKK